MKLKSLIGTKAFYKRIFSLCIPVMIQNGITNLVNLLDNVMVGTLGTEALSAVSIVNQFVFIFNLVIFGATSAAGIFTAQYHGSGDAEGVRSTVRFKGIVNIIVSAICIALFLIFDDQLINLFLFDGSAEGDIALTLKLAKEYLAVAVIGFVPFGLANVYLSTLRETGDTVRPVYASAAAVATNCIGNAILIFGLFGAPALGVVGAAIATTLSRFVEFFILFIYSHTHTEKCYFAKGLWRTFRIPSALFGRILIKGLPLMLNEFFWSLAVTMRNQAYATRGLDVVAAQTVAVTVHNLVSVVWMSVGFSIAFIVGNLLGAGKVEEARDTGKKMMALSVVVGVILGGLMAALSPVFPLMFGVTETVYSLAEFMLIVFGICTPVMAFSHASYFTLRTGGKILITVLLDAGFMWSVAVPVAYCLSRFTSLPIEPLFILSQSCEVIKCIAAFILVSKVDWASRLVSDEPQKTVPETSAESLPQDTVTSQVNEK
ncbi:MAG: MATE family efflux transporter [Clostridia bacterium]|nr:MATE family efflux transporter [Clostridia bacterium]